MGSLFTLYKDTNEYKNHKEDLRLQEMREKFGHLDDFLIIDHSKQ